MVPLEQALESHIEHANHSLQQNNTHDAIKYANYAEAALRDLRVEKENDRNWLNDTLPHLQDRLNTLTRNIAERGQIESQQAADWFTYGAGAAALIGVYCLEGESIPKKLNDTLKYAPRLGASSLAKSAVSAISGLLKWSIFVSPPALCMGKAYWHRYQAKILLQEREQTIQSITREQILNEFEEIENTSISANVNQNI